MSNTGKTTSATMVAIFFVAVTAITIWYFAQPWLPPVASVHGRDVDYLIRYLLAATGGLFVAGHAVLIAFVLKFQGEGSSRYRPVRTRAEWLTALAPVLLMASVSEVGVLVLGTPVWGQVYGPPPEGALEVEAVAKQFAWTIRYPGADGAFGRTDSRFVDDAENPVGIDATDPAAADDIVTRGEMGLPLGRPVVVRLRSLDLLHSFSVPLFRTKQDIVPGMVQRTRFVPDVAGRYEIACAELCGLGHYRMRGFVEVMTDDAFAAWLSEQGTWKDNSYE